MTRCTYCAQSPCQCGANDMETVVVCEICGRRGREKVVGFVPTTGKARIQFVCPSHCYKEIWLNCRPVEIER